MEELNEALRMYRESLAEIESVRHAGHSVADSQEVYVELQEAIALTEEALNELQRTEALKRGRQGATDLATEQTPTSEAVRVLLQSGAVQAEVMYTQQPQQQMQPSTEADLPPSKRQKQQVESAAGLTIGPQLPHPAIPRQHHLHSSSNSGKQTTHPRNKYADRAPDFKALGQAFPELQQHLRLHQGGATIDFRNAAACKALTRALLQHDFGITWDVPDGQLVPPVTNRANYIHWLEDLLVLSPQPNTEFVTGLDVGCGANCIYPLLGAALNGWRFVGTDITDIALEWAKQNVGSNPNLAKLIEIRRTGHSNKPLDPANVNGGILLPAVREEESFSFCMCNPPFFGSLQEAGRNPKTAYAGTPEEMVCPGGELAFVTQMVKDSLQLQGHIHWYTSMVGKKSTLKQLRRLLHGSKVTALRSTEFVQGRTSRWAIAWSFSADPHTENIPMPRYAPSQSTIDL